MIVGSNVVVKAGANIDYETATQHVLNVRITDDDGKSLVSSITINVTDQVETLTADPSGGNLRSGAGNDILVGGAKNGQLIGGAGSDEYRYLIGGGDDRIVESGSNADMDRLILGQGILLSDITIARSTFGSPDVVMRLVGGGSILLKDQLADTSGSGIEQVQFANGTTWSKSDIMSFVQSDSYFGTGRLDVIGGSVAAEIFDGGAGNDLLQGYGGGDTYVFGSSFGSDRIVEGNESGTDRVRFTSAIPSDANLFRSGYDLIIKIGSSSITITNQFLWPDTGVEELIFSDNTVWNKTEIEQRAVQSSGQSNTVIGTSGNDMLQAGAGDNIVKGGDGSDTYVYLAGDGNDIIDDGVNNAAQTDILQLDDLHVDEIEVSRVGNDLIIKVIDTSETIKVINQFASTSDFWGIENIQFANGVVWDRAAIAENGWTRGTATGENMNGTSADEVFDGAGGNDNLSGGGGSDTFVYKPGSGTDTIYEGNSATDIDTVKLIGLKASGVQLRRWDNDLFLKILASGEELRVSNQFSDGNGIERILFADGTSLDRSAIAGQAWYRAGSGNYNVNASAGDDIIDAGGGSDNISGALGAIRTFMARDPATTRSLRIRRQPISIRSSSSICSRPMFSCGAGTMICS